MPDSASRRPFTATLAGLTLAFACLVLSGCGIFVEKANPGIVEPRVAVPQDFLFSWHEPYNQWMDTPVRVTEDSLLPPPWYTPPSHTRAEPGDMDRETASLSSG